MSNRMGSKFAFVTVAALLAAACSKEPEPEVTAPTVEEEQMAPVEQPKTAEELMVEEFGLPNQTGLNDYMDMTAGADRVFFAYDSSELNDDGRAVLEAAAKWMSQGYGYARVSLTIEGHCDERGTREYNLALGDRRANAVKNYLVALGVPSTRLQTISYGKERPVASGGDESTHARNRRGVLRVN
ncbi:hypothetical protein GCM10017044_17280 [Kordiimonas sediminis]|uniref:Peptidoglycan-associated lipoprotein n=1 Tax=Kordiimonas sediminis TaxID=1735581 RepID=A0A919ATF0_9PROT|nr:peptidoglycan-associated lipoprotein Pal [Kordiimonas sediminis]GHF23313.1 hypothetical protein GCM10017044_17280 [Kordiimonas sediminis]